MLIRLGYDLVFNLPAPCPMLLLLFVHPDRAASLRRPDQLHTEPALPIEEFTDSFGNRCARIVAPAGRLRLFSETVIEDSGLLDEQAPDAVQHPVQDLPPAVLPYLLSSRYCEVDELSEIAWNLLGTTPPGWARAQAVCDFVQGHLRFDYASARPTRTALDAFEEKVGVCRDFTHLAITLCRCLNLPARYATGYLGDIGVLAAPYPMDFSAWFEVFLSGRWYTFDARHNRPRIGRVLMARGRDAVDVALTTSFGVANLAQFIVHTEEVANVGGAPMLG